MDDLAITNKFIKLFEELYDAKFTDKYNKTESDIIVEEKPIQKKGFFWKKEVIEPEPVISPKTQKINDIKYYLDDILSKPNQDFWTLWSFCQFVRWAEKVLLYKNNPDNIGTFYVDSQLKDDTREFLINKGDYKIFIKLQLLSKPNSSLIDQQYNQVITILVTRDFGKKMENKYVVIDGEVELDDDSDLYLVNQINKEINNAIMATVKDIIVNNFDMAPITFDIYFTKSKIKRKEEE